jgi:DNA (cytosine-5)-methyltransferase 1
MGGHSLAKEVRPRVIFLEKRGGIPDVGADWKGQPSIKELAGTTFHEFVRQLRALGYIVEWRELVACDYGAPTSRKRFVCYCKV